MASLESEMRRIKKLADDRATAAEGAPRPSRETATWWASLSRRERITELRAALTAPEATSQPLCAVRCPHHLHALLHALLLRAGAQERRDFLRVDIARVWDVARLDYGGGDGAPVAWQDFFDVLAEITDGAAPGEPLPFCPVCEPDACPLDDQIAGWIRPLPPEQWLLLVLLGQRLNWREPVPSIETQWRWVSGQEPVPDAQEQFRLLPLWARATPPAAWDAAWTAAQHDLAEVLATSPAYKTIVAGTRR